MLKVTTVLRSSGSGYRPKTTGTTFACLKRYSNDSPKRIGVSGTRVDLSLETCLTLIPRKIPFHTRTWMNWTGGPCIGFRRWVHVSSGPTISLSFILFITVFTTSAFSISPPSISTSSKTASMFLRRNLEPGYPLKQPCMKFLRSL